MITITPKNKKCATLKLIEKELLRGFSRNYSNLNLKLKK